MEDALYRPENGIERMFSDLESYIQPLYIKFEPLMQALSNIAFVIIPLISVCLLFYIAFFRKHHILNKLTSKNNYIFWTVSLIAYIGLTFTRIDLGYSFSIDSSRLVLPLIAKLSGPYISGIFAILQYIATTLINGGNLNILLILIAASSGMLYGLFFYRKHTKYTRCLGAKIVINMVCNVFLTSFAVCAQNPSVIASQLTLTTIDSLIMAPIQALFIFLLFRLVRIFKERLAF